MDEFPSNTPSGDALYQDPELARFYDLDNGWSEGLSVCANLAQRVPSILDLGCGTGALIASFAPDKLAVGVDPAAAMLDIARARPGGKDARWVEADARELRLEKRFDLVVLTGNAFQVFLTRQDRLAVLETIAGHLSAKGRFVFDTRNPLAEEWREWTPDETRRVLTHPRHGRIEAWNDARMDPVTGIVTYQTHYRVDDGRAFSANSEIAFPERSEIAALIEDAGLAVRSWWGDWDGSPLTDNSLEIIPLGRLA